MPDVQVDILVGNLHDDVGAFEVMRHVVGGEGKLYVNTALQCDYDVAVMAIPFDGRWQNGVHFRAKKVLDGRTRPDPSTTGLISWKKHEVEYQMDNARELGFQGFTPDCSFLQTPKISSYSKGFVDRLYLGIGYKKDVAGFWQMKHWGNENYGALVKILLEKYPALSVHTTGNVADFHQSIGPISRIVNNKRFVCTLSKNLYEAFDKVSSCYMYVGNDTGMMHVAASCNRRVTGLFFLEHSITKNRPWCDMYTAIDGVYNRDKVTPEYVLSQIEDLYEERRPE
jgi:ADP-heptose:LPS heptosyltransferase